MCEEEGVERELEELRGDVEAKRKVLGRIWNAVGKLEARRNRFDARSICRTSRRRLSKRVYVYFRRRCTSRRAVEARATKWRGRAGGDFGIAATPRRSRDDGGEEERSPPKAARRRITAGIISVDEVRAVEDAVGAAVGRFPGCTRSASRRPASGDVRVFSPTSSSSTSSSPTLAAARGRQWKGRRRFSMNCLRTTRAKRRRITPISPSPRFSFDASCSRYNAKPYAWAQNLAGASFSHRCRALADSLRSNASEIARTARATDDIRAIKDARVQA